jgi:hypothetical protein
MHLARDAPVRPRIARNARLSGMQVPPSAGASCAFTVTGCNEVALFGLSAAN